MNRFILAICILFVSIQINAQNAGDYQTKASGNWNSIATWERFDGSNWLAAITTPTSLDGRITIKSPHTVTISADVTIDETNVEFGGTLNKSATLTIGDGSGVDLDCSGSFSISGTLNGTGQVSINNGGVFGFGGFSLIETSVVITIQAGGSAGFSLGNSTLKGSIINNGTINWSSGNLSMSGNLTNNGMLNLTGNVNLFFGGSGFPLFTNSVTGIINNLNSGSSLLNSLDFTFNNHGQVNVQQGLLLLGGKGTHTGSFNISAGKTLEIRGAHVLDNGSSLNSVGGQGTVHFNFNNVDVSAGCLYSSALKTIITSIVVWDVPTQSFSDLELSIGKILGTSNITILNSFCWCGEAHILGAGSFTISNGATATFGAGNKTLSKNLINNGVINWPVNTTVGGTGSMTNNSVMNNKGNVDVNFTNSASGVIHEINGEGRTHYKLVNHGEINVENGELFIAGSIGAHTGSIKINTGKKVHIRGSHTFNAGSSIITVGGPAEVTMSDAGVTFENGMVFDPTLSILQTGGTNTWNITNQVINNYTTDASAEIKGVGNLVIQHNFNWFGAFPSMQGTGTFTIANGAVATFSSSNTNLQKTFINNGIINWSSAHEMGTTASLGHLINNGILNLNNTNIPPNGNSNGAISANLTNSVTGIINKPAGGHGFTISGTFNNRGVVNLQSGGIALNAGNPGIHDGRYNIFPSTIIAGSVSLPFSGPSFTNNGTVLLANLKFTGTSSQLLDGNGTINVLSIDGAGLSLGGNQTINNTLVLTNGKISLGNNNLVIGSSTLTGGNANSYIITNGSGSFQRRASALTGVLFPLGTAISYTPMTITPKSGHIADDFKARVLDNVFSGYDLNQNPTGPIIPSNLVNRSWLLNEINPGGSIVDIKLQWNPVDQSTGFFPTACRFGTFESGIWNLGSLTNAGSPSSLTKTNVNSFSPMTVIGQYVSAINSYNPQCGGSILQVDYIPVGTFNNGNVFTVQLSDGSGSFVSPVDIGSISSTSAASINALLPNNTSFGTGYRIRVKSSNPVSTGSDNGSDIVINPKSNAGVINGDDEVCIGDIIDYFATGEPGGLWESTNPAVLSINPVTGSANAVAEGTATVKYTVGIACPDISVRNIVVTGIPQIQTHPTDLIKCVGEAGAFSVSATDFNLTYQWRKNGVILQGQTNSTCFIGGISLADAGVYDVVINNGCNSIISSGAILTVNTAPVITAQPASTSVCLGQPLHLTVSATGTDLTYQWFKNNNLLFGQTSSNFDIPVVSVNDAGDYQVVINGLCSPEAVSSLATVLIIQEPVFQGTLLPAIFKCPGENLILSGAATGVNVSYQWYRNNLPIPGATNILFEINGLMPSNSATYHVIATNICGSTTSNACLLTVYEPPVIITQPVSQTFCAPNPVTLSVIASGDNLTYSWRKNGIDINGETNSSLVTNESGNYSVLVTGACSSLESAIVTVQEILAPVIFQQPLSQTVCAGTLTSFFATAINNFSGYQWMKDGIDIPGETSSTLLLDNISVADAGAYQLKVLWDCTPAVLSQPAQLVVNDPIVVQISPVNLVKCIGDPVEFSVFATGTGVMYQWFKNNVLINGATSSTLPLGFANPSMAGTYSVSITGACQPGTSLSATLTIQEPPQILTHPVNQSKCIGDAVTFNVVASGTNLQYQWQKDLVNISGATTSSYSIGPVGLSDIGSYRVIITGDCSGPLTSNAAILTIGDPPVIGTQPLSQSKCPGEPVTFSVAATGNNLGYQWRKDGIYIVGATNSSYTILSVSPADVGSYDVMINNSCSGVTSIPASLSLLPSVSAGTINGPSFACRNRTIQFTTTGTPNGIWESSDPAIATVNPSNGLVTTLISGTTNIIYRVSGCANPSFSSRILNVEPYLTASPITGPSSFCSSGLGSILKFETFLSGNYSGIGGDWSVSAPLQISFTEFENFGNGLLARAYLNHTNLVAGTYQIQFNPSNGCGLEVPVTKTIQVIQAPDPGTITGAAFVCLSSISSYTHGGINGNGNGNGGGSGGSNGFWAVSDPTILSLVSTNTNSASVRGLRAGTAHLIYVVNNGTCTDTVRKTITVSQMVCPAGAPFTRSANVNCEYKIIGTEFDLVNPNLCSGTLKYILSGATSKTRSASTLNGVILEKGTTTITWIFTSQGINISCSFQVTVRDQTDPVITCPNNITATTNTCSTAINTPRPSFSDNCSMDQNMTLTWKIERNNQIVTFSPTTGINYVGARIFGVGVNKITYLLSDETGNSKSCSFTVTVNGGLFCISKGIIEDEKIEASGFNVIISPNPTENNFSVNVESDIHDKVSIRVYDLSGRNVELLEGSPYNPFVFGVRLTAGVYMAEIRQGKYRKLIKLIKQ